MTVALIDGDILVYRAAFAVEKTTYRLRGVFPEFDESIDITFEKAKEMKTWREENPEFEQEGEVEKAKVIEPASHALKIIDSMMTTLTSNVKPDQCVVYLSGKGNYRYDVAKQRPYKENRPPKPTHYQAVRDYLVERYKAAVTVGEEADDALGIHQHQDFKLHNGQRMACNTIICSIDKDLLMIPGWHYNIVKEEVTWMSEDDANMKFWHQMITGDATDTIPGLKGKGPKFADALMEDVQYIPELVRQNVFELYEEQFGDNWKDVINEMAQLLWIRREPSEMRTVV